MKMGVRFERFPKFFLKYEEDEWNMVESLLKRLGLRVCNSERILGKKRGKFYRETSSELGVLLLNSTSTSSSVSDINQPLFDSGFVNISVFRVLPDEDGCVEFLLDKFLTIEELNRVVETLSQVFEKIINLVIDEEVEIDVNK